MVVLYGVMLCCQSTYSSGQWMCYLQSRIDLIIPTSYAVTALKDARKVKQFFCIAIDDDPAQEKDAMKIN